MLPACKEEGQSPAGTVVVLPQDSAAAKRHKSFLAWKRLFDVIFSGGLLLLTWPLFVIIGALVRREDQGPVFYRHRRVGLNGREFFVWKFRTMNENADRAAFTPEQREEWRRSFKLRPDPRVTRIGKVLRRTSLDELPQLLNILAGSMSFVGPRPVVEKELAMYGFLRERFLSVKPGLTGYWQAYGRGRVGYEMGGRQAMELYYINNAGLRLDIKILLRTVRAVLTRDGAE